MNRERERSLERMWAGLKVLDQLSRRKSGLASAEVAEIVGARNAKGIGGALSGTRSSLNLAGIRLDEAVRKRVVGGRTFWLQGPRIRQARHVLEQTRRTWNSRECGDPIPTEEVGDGYRGPVLVLRALRSRGGVCRVDGGLVGLDAILDDEHLEVENGQLETIGEVFIHCIEPRNGGLDSYVPEGYEENGIWVRDAHDYAHPRVAGGIGTGRDPSLVAWIGEATIVEQRIALVDPVRQVLKVHASSGPLAVRRDHRWQALSKSRPLRYVSWIGAHGYGASRSAPPLRMRLRCWYEIVIENANGRRFVLREEGLRGDDGRTSTRAIRRWRESQAGAPNQLVGVREIRIAKRQPRPMPPA